jgi:hypothetical protein
MKQGIHKTVLREIEWRLELGTQNKNKSRSIAAVVQLEVLFGVLAA